MVILLICLSIVAENQELTLTDRNIYSYGKSLMEEGDYYRAIGEFKRLIYYFPRSSLVDSANFLIGLSYYKAGRFNESYSVFENFAKSKEDKKDPLFYSAVLYMGKSKLKDGSLNRAKDIFLYISSEPITDTSIIYETNKYLILSNLLLKDFNKARIALKSSKLRRKERYNLIELIEMGEALPKKSLILATAMSTVIPGTGQIYSGRYVDGLISLAFNSYNAYALITLLKKNASVSKILMQLSISIPFYLGNIYGAALAAHKYNKRKETAYYKELASLLEE